MACFIDSCVPTHSSTEISSDSLRHVFDLRSAFVTTFGYNVGRTKLSREFLPRFVAAHRDDALSTHLACGEHSERTDSAVADHRNCPARVYARCVRGEPTGTQDIGSRYQARDQFFGRNIPLPRGVITSLSIVMRSMSGG
jgi:hypothetical protein